MSAHVEAAGTEALEAGADREGGPIREVGVMRQPRHNPPVTGERSGSTQLACYLAV